MKKLLLYTLLAVSILGFSCKKDKPKEFLEGWWQGSLYKFGDPNAHDIQIWFKKNNTIEV